jgi:hypothetical protein
MKGRKSPRRQKANRPRSEREATPEIADAESTLEPDVFERLRSLGGIGPAQLREWARIRAEQLRAARDRAEREEKRAAKRRRGRS